MTKSRVGCGNFACPRIVQWRENERRRVYSITWLSRVSCRRDAPACAGILPGGQPAQDSAPVSTRKPPQDIILECIHAAGTAPNGANKQPWHFVVVSDPLKKSEIRQAAEIEEREFYERRASQEWLEDLLPFRTNANKPYLEIAPYLIAIFVRSSQSPPGRHPRKTVLHTQIGWDRDRDFDRCLAYRRAHQPYPYTQPDGIPKPDPKSSAKRAPISTAGRWISGGGRPGAQYSPQRIRRNRQHIPGGRRIIPIGHLKINLFQS